ncbi:MAG: PAS domain-containing protein [Chitinophagaceae bacterium]|nr:PAS domain-containing protein [Chitinophagaceae bacterium]
MKKLSSPIKLALIFLLFGIIWVLATDFILSISSHDQPQLERFQSYKGILFMVLSALLIFFVSRKLYGNIEKARREQEEALQRYNVLGMATNDAIWDLNFKTGECFTNKTLQEIFGYTAQELSDNNIWWRNNLHPEDSDRIIARLDAKLKEGSTIWQDEYRFRCKNGSYKTVFDRGFVIRDAKGNPERLIGSMQDVTEQRILQQQLIDQKVKHTHEMTQSIINAHEAERKKLAEELHDNVNQLLGVVKLYVEHARVDPPGKNEVLKKSSEYLDLVIREIRQLSKTLTPPTLSLNGLVASITDMITSIEQARNIVIELDATGFEEKLLSSSKQLMTYRIIQEQLNNVLKHSEADQVSIALRQSNGVVQLTINDNGIGFDTQMVKQGLGLNNIRNRLEVVNGNMNIRSQPGGGCTLVIDFQND